MTTKGTTQPGNHTNGKYKTAILGWSKANCWIGKGAERIALITIFNKSPRQIKFQIRIILGESLFFTNPKYQTNGAVIPAIISKFRPSKVINSGILPSKKRRKKDSLQTKQQEAKKPRRLADI